MLGLHQRLAVAGIIAFVWLPLSCASNHGQTTTTDGDAGTPEADVPDATPVPCPAYPYGDVRSFTTTMQPSGDETDVYFPYTDASARPAAGFPLAVFLQGANVSKEYYSSFARAIAAQGFVFVIANHQAEVFKTQGLWANQDEVLWAMSFAKDANGSIVSPLYGQIDLGHVAVLGHSFGGAAAVGAVASTCSLPFCSGDSWTRPQEVVAGAFFGTNLQSPLGGPIPPIDNAGIPVLFVQGSADGRAAPADGRQTFDSVEHPPKAYVVIDGMNHYGITDQEDPPGAAADPNAATIPHDEALAATSRWMGTFLRAYVLHDDAALARIRTANFGCTIPGTLVFEP